MNSRGGKEEQELKEEGTKVKIREAEEVALSSKGIFLFFVELQNCILNDLCRSLW